MNKITRIVAVFFSLFLLCSLPTAAGQIIISGPITASDNFPLDAGEDFKFQVTIDDALYDPFSTPAESFYDISGSVGFGGISAFAAVSDPGIVLHNESFTGQVRISDSPGNFLFIMDLEGGVGTDLEWATSLQFGASDSLGQSFSEGFFEDETQLAPYFQSLVDQGFYAVYDFSADYDDGVDFASSSASGSIDSAQLIPEPSAGVLIALGLLVFMCRRRKISRGHFVLAMFICAWASLGFGPSVNAAQVVSIPGATFSTTAGTDENPYQGDTYFRYSITTNGSNGVINQPEVPAATANFLIANDEWLKPADHSNLISMSGRVTSMPTVTNTSFQVGFITREAADVGQIIAPSVMTSNSAFMEFTPGSIFVGDTRASRSLVATGYNAGEVDNVDFEIQFDFDQLTVAGRVKIDSDPWTDWVSQGFGTHDWAGVAMETSFALQEIAFIAMAQNGYYTNNPGGTQVSVSFEDITTSVAVIPEPSTAALLVMGIVPLLMARRRP